MSNYWIAFDAYMGVNSKLLNATKHDIGIGNIKLETAKKVYERNRDKFDKKIKNWAELVDYLRTDAPSVPM
jgi:hypothetical protein